MRFDGQTPREFYLSHAVINTIQAGFRGELAALETLEELGSPYDKQDRVDFSRAVIAWTSELTELLFSGVPLVTPGDFPPVYPQANNAWKMLSELRKNLLRQASILDEFSHDRIRTGGMKTARSLVASLRRFAASRRHSIDGWIEYSKRFGLSEREQRWRRRAVAAETYSRRVDLFLVTLRSGRNLRGRFLKRLRQFVCELPGVFRANAHEIVTIFGMAKSQLTYDMVGIDAGETLHWKAAGLDPESAGYWRAFGVPPEESVLWRAAELSVPADVAPWRSRGFEADSAGSWVARGFDAVTASHWRDRGFEAAREAARWRTSGFTQPITAHAWRKQGFLPEQAITWSAHFTPAQAAKWRASGVHSAIQAKNHAKVIERLLDMKKQQAAGKETGNEAAPTTSTGSKMPVATSMLPRTRTGMQRVVEAITETTGGRKRKIKARFDPK